MFGKNHLFRGAALAGAFTLATIAAHATNVACVGNSITEGYGIDWGEKKLERSGGFAKGSWSVKDKSKERMFIFKSDIEFAKECLRRDYEEASEELAIMQLCDARRTGNRRFPRFGWIWPQQCCILGRKELGYMYFDNKVTKKASSDANDYITPEDTIYYAGGKIEKWRGLLSTLNQWVTKMNGENSTLSTLKPFTVWFRPTTELVNGDLPVLGFPKDNAMATLDSDGKYLQYGSNVC